MILVSYYSEDKKTKVKFSASVAKKKLSLTVLAVSCLFFIFLNKFMHDLVNLVNHIRRIHLFHLPTWAAEHTAFS